jgi:heme oxygenase
LPVRAARVTRSGLIAQDLLALGFSARQIAQLPQCHTISPFGTATEALGWMYVVERAALLHDALYKHLTVTLAEAGAAFAYLDESRRAVARWHALGVALDQHASTRELGDRIVAAAFDAFETMLHWQRTWDAGSPRSVGAAQR